ncbi:MAG: heme-dependent oxidative N-demethylase family protein [Paracoccaceae bacterium]
MTDLVLQARLPDPPWLDPVRWRLPGVEPLAEKDWLIQDEAFAGQMALRDRLIATEQESVHVLQDSAIDGARECYDLVLSVLAAAPGYALGERCCTRPDGVTVPLDRSAPLLTLGRLMQADICLMQPGTKGHFLAGAILCFPAYWTLSEKIGRPMTAIHAPVSEYNTNIARRVQRLFDAMRPEQLLWRMNANLHTSGALFTPKLEAEPESRVGFEDGHFVRCERQVLRKLPKTGVTVFSIHTYMVRIQDLTLQAQATLSRLVPNSEGK